MRLLRLPRRKWVQSGHLCTWNCSGRSKPEAARAMAITKDLTREFLLKSVVLQLI